MRHGRRKNAARRGCACCQESRRGEPNAVAWQLCRASGNWRSACSENVVRARGASSIFIMDARCTPLYTGCVVRCRKLEYTAKQPSCSFEGCTTSTPSAAPPNFPRSARITSRGCERRRTCGSTPSSASTQSPQKNTTSERGEHAAPSLRSSEYDTALSCGALAWTVAHSFGPAKAPTYGGKCGTALQFVSPAAGGRGGSIIV